MFEFLDKEPVDRVLEALYFGARIITHRDRANGAGRVGPFKGISTEPSEEDAKLGRQIVSELLRREGSDLQNLSRDAAGRVVSELYSLAHRRISLEPGPRPAPGKARRLLNQWRRDRRNMHSPA